MAFDGDGGGRGVETGEELEEAAATFGEVLCGRGAVEGEPEIDDGDVDGVCLYEVFGFASGAGAEGLDAHWFEEAGELIDPGLGSPAGV